MHALYKESFRAAREWLVDRRSARDIKTVMMTMFACPQPMQKKAHVGEERENTDLKRQQQPIEKHNRSSLRFVCPGSLFTCL